jgi:hypothetical protein
MCGSVSRRWKALLSDSAVAEAAVIGTPDAKWVEAVTAVVVASADLSEEELLARVRTRLASFQWPKPFPLSTSRPPRPGKMLKCELRTQAPLVRLWGRVPSVAPGACSTTMTVGSVFGGIDESARLQSQRLRDAQSGDQGPSAAASLMASSTVSSRPAPGWA